MREKFIIVSGINGTSILKNLAYHNISLINTRICNPYEFARDVLLRNGIAVEEDFLNSRETVSLVSKAVEGEKYFPNPTYSDLKEIASAISKIRNLVTEENEIEAIERILSAGIFEEKNAALIKVCTKYINLLAKQKKVDASSLIRKAIKNAKEIDADIVVLKEYQLTPLEERLIDVVSNGQYTRQSIFDMFDSLKKPISISKYLNCYGMANEVETIITDIYENRRLDQCVVAVSDEKSYGQLFFDYSRQYRIPITFGCGIPITNSNPAKILESYFKWAYVSFFGKDELLNLINGEGFDRNLLEEELGEKPENYSQHTFSEILGGIRLTNNASINDERIKNFVKAIEFEESLVSETDEREYKKFLKKKACVERLYNLARELALPAEVFISKYSKIRTYDDILRCLDLSAKTVIYEEMSTISSTGINQSVEDIIPALLNVNVCRQSSEPGKLHITGISAALVNLREVLYVVGLSASKYPGSPIENYLLLDKDLVLFGENAMYLSSNGRIEKKRDTLMSLIEMASAFNNTIVLSYAGMNVSELKCDNASSMLFEIFSAERGKTATLDDLEKMVEKVAYFDPRISNVRAIGMEYVADKIIVPSKYCEPEKFIVEQDLQDVPYAPSALDSFFSCPYGFMLSYLLGIYEPEESDPFEVIPATDYGTLAHSLMEVLANSKIEKDDFIKLSGEYFDRYLLSHPPILMEKALAVKDTFLEMMEVAYLTDPHRKVLFSEKLLKAKHETGINLQGYPDRVEELEDGSVLVVDFKTGRKIKHNPNDIATCLQVVIYSYMLEQLGYKVAGGEYRYLRMGETVRCDYNDEIKNELNSRLQEFRTHMVEGDFPHATTFNGSEEGCRFCKFASICGKPILEEE